MNNNGRTATILTVLTLIAGVCACIAAWLVVPQIQGWLFPPPSATPIPSSVVQHPTSEIIDPTLTAAPVATNEIEPANTLPPTSTSIPPPTIQSTVSISLPFQDTFDLRLAQDWQQVLGTWRVVNGHLTTDANDDWRRILVGDSAWQNYAVEVDAWSEDWLYPVQIIVRAQQGTYVAMETNIHNTNFILYGGGEPITIANSDVGIDDQSGNRYNWTYHLRVEVVGDIFTAYINGNMILQVQDSILSTGRTGLAFRTYYSTWFDNFQVSQHQ